MKSSNNILLKLRILAIVLFVSAYLQICLLIQPSNRLIFYACFWVEIILRMNAIGIYAITKNRKPYWGIFGFMIPPFDLLVFVLIVFFQPGEYKKKKGSHIAAFWMFIGGLIVILGSALMYLRVVMDKYALVDHGAGIECYLYAIIGSLFYFKGLEVILNEKFLHKDSTDKLPDFQRQY